MFRTPASLLSLSFTKLEIKTNPKLVNSLIISIFYQETVCNLLWRYWLTDWLTDWLNEWMIDWLTDWLTEWLNDRSIDWLIDWLIDYGPMFARFALYNFAITLNAMKNNETCPGIDCQWCHVADIGTYFLFFSWPPGVGYGAPLRTKSSSPKWTIWKAHK